MRVTITTKPTGAVQKVWLVPLEVGRTYALEDDVSRALILNGYAIEERRWAERRRVRRPESPGRRSTD
jgi:hypothetical protein